MTPELAHDYLHPRSKDPYWNESAWFGFAVPERDLSGFVYFYHRPNMGYTVGGVALWDPTGAENYDCLCYDWGEPYPMAEGAEMFDFAVDNGLRVHLVEPLREYKLDYRGENDYVAGGCTFDLTFRGNELPHMPGLPEGVDEWGQGHYDQGGRMTGVITLGRETIEIDTVAQRDHSWGVRKLSGNPRGQMIWAVGENSGFHALAVSRIPPADDPVLGTMENVIIGNYLMDGQYGDLTASAGNTISVLERDPTGRPARYLLDATDSLGRDLHAEGRVRNMLNWQGFSWLMTHWSLVEWTFDGQTAFGEGQDYWPLQQSRTFLRSCR